MKNKPSLYTANSVCMLVVSGILLGAFYFQFVLGEDPCPLCLLQRTSMLGVMLGLCLNTYFGFRNQHVAVIIIASLVGATFSIRQVLLHICPVPGEPTGYGTPILGLHLYSWGVFIFTASILGAAVFLCMIDNEEPETRRQPSSLEKIACYVAAAVCFANTVAAFVECHLGPCCENGPCP